MIKVSDSPVRHKMAYIGHEPERGTLKYRCPAQHEGWECPMSAECNAGKSYGKTVRVPHDLDPRRFPALPRATKKFERMYKGRTSVERINARLKLFWGVDDGNLTGSRRFVAQVGVVLAVHAAFATLLASAPRRDAGKDRAEPDRRGQAAASRSGRGLKLWSRRDGGVFAIAAPGSAGFSSTRDGAVATTDSDRERRGDRGFRLRRNDGCSVGLPTTTQPPPGPVVRLTSGRTRLADFGPKLAATRSVRQDRMVVDGTGSEEPTAPGYRAFCGPYRPPSDDRTSTRLGAAEGFGREAAVRRPGFAATSRSTS